MRETESLLIAAQNNATRTNYIKARIDKTPQNRKSMLCSDRDETINYIISKYSKLEQKEYKTRHNWVGKVINWELWKKLKFVIRTSVLCTTRNPSQRMRRTNFLRIFIYKRISSRRPDLVIVKNKNKKKSEPVE